MTIQNFINQAQNTYRATIESLEKIDEHDAISTLRHKWGDTGTGEIDLDLPYVQRKIGELIDPEHDNPRQLFIDVLDSNEELKADMVISKIAQRHRDKLESIRKLENSLEELQAELEDRKRRINIAIRQDIKSRFQDREVYAGVSEGGSIYARLEGDDYHIYVIGRIR